MPKSMPLFLLLACALWLPGAAQVFDAQGQFTYVLNDEIVAEENFTFTQQEDGNTRLEAVFIALSEEFLLEFETDRLFDQTAVFTPELGLVSYLLASDTARGTFNVEVAVADGIASMSFSTVDKDSGETRSGTQDVILEDDAVASGISGSGSQLTLLQEIIFRRAITQDTTLLAFNPTDLFNPVVEVNIAPLPEVTVTAAGETFQAQRFSVSQLLEGEDGDPFTVELLSRDGKMIGYRAFSQTSTLLVYRSDLFPDGIEVAQ